ncbi:Hypothetical Protein FCC1311_008422 [Hondaea fermentalgiana]|uniref:Aminoglycoside phosphotransferase domain-containing protein n=1 Tax=Hondaea fermentalgiana TaxID=2315210 RepID=A0A2R5G808_9STRA|nr:Hypothetical Protein FCC1311_008422 [Hondaea fermentalgiana]|eukprot:GBG24623.1 Hypothetical Protein FCC1311_008422 [Hondaea fermentalgiana]
MAKKKKKQQQLKQQDPKPREALTKVAAALEALDGEALRQGLRGHVQEANTLQSVPAHAREKIEQNDASWIVRKTVGEAFTGGRSTPVFEVQTGDEAPFLICKLVDIANVDSPKGRVISLSYAMEARFYAVCTTQLAAAAEAGASIPIPACIHAEVDTDSGRFAFVSALIHPSDPWVKAQSPEVQRISRLLQEFATIIHGDLKAANLFLSEDACAGVDFQFSGLGLGCVDLAYFFFPDARGDYFDAMPGLINAYWDALVETCPRFAAFPLDKLERLVDFAQVDLFRYYLGRGWVPASVRDVLMIERVNATLGTLDEYEQISSAAYASAIQTVFGS